MTDKELDDLKDRWVRCEPEWNRRQELRKQREEEHQQCRAFFKLHVLPNVEVLSSQEREDYLPVLEELELTASNAGSIKPEILMAMVAGVISRRYHAALISNAIVAAAIEHVNE